MILSSCVFLAFALVGAAVGGVVGTVVGNAVAAWVGVLIAWRQLGAALREYGQAPIRMAAIRWPGRPNPSARAQHWRRTG